MKFFQRIAILGVLAGLLAGVLPSITSAQFPDERTWGRTSAGTGNAQTIQINNYQAHTQGVVHRFIAGATNTGPATINISGLGAVALKQRTAVGLADLGGREIVVGQQYAIMYDGTNYVLQSSQATQNSIQVNRGLAYSITSIDCGTVQVLGGGTFYNVTVPNPVTASLPPGCTITFTNSDGRGKGITFDAGLGALTTTLYQTQTMTLVSNTALNVWAATDPGRYRSSPTFHVNFANGSDDRAASDCLANNAGACKTFAGAILRLYTDISTDTGSPTIQADCESSYDQRVAISGPVVGANHLVLVTGNPTTPSACAIVSTTPANIIDVQDKASVKINGFTIGFGVGGSSAASMYARQFSILDYANLIMGNATGNFHFYTQDEASMNGVGPITVAGNAAALWRLTGNSHMVPPHDVVGSGTPNVGTMFSISSNSVLDASEVGTINFTGSNISGIAWTVGQCSTLILNGTVLPTFLAPGSPAIGQGGCYSVQ